MESIHNQGASDPINQTSVSTAPQVKIVSTEKQPAKKAVNKLLASYDDDYLALYRVNGGQLGDSEGHYAVQHAGEGCYTTMDPMLAAAIFSLVSLELFLNDYFDSRTGYRSRFPDFDQSKVDRGYAKRYDLADFTEKIRSLIYEIYEELPPLWS